MGAGCLVDCLTIWLNNLMFHERDIAAATQALISVIHKRVDPVILVTNEVGSGIVPENALARRFRDEAGRMNKPWLRLLMKYMSAFLAFH